MVVRPVSAGLVLRMLVFSPVGLAGTIALCASQVFGWVFIPMIDVAGLWEWSGPTQRSEARVVEVRPTNVSVNRRRMFAVDFEHAGQRGTSYSSQGGGLSPGEPVAIEHPTGKPAGARIVGMGRRPMPGWVLLPALLPAVAGAVLLAIALALALRRARILAAGQPATGRLVAREPTNVRVNRQPVIRFRYDVTTSDGRKTQAIWRTHRTAHIPETVTALVHPETLAAVIPAALPARGTVFAALLLGLATGGWLVLVLL